MSASPGEALFRADGYARHCEARVTGVRTRDTGALEMQLDRTVFYANSGGQPGDTGHLQAADGRTWQVVDTRKDAGPDDIWHVLEAGAAAPEVGTQLSAALDWERRHRHMRFHTALHVLCSLLDGLATGNQIYADKARLDYDSHGAVPDKAELEARLNAATAAAHACETIWITDEEMLARPELIKSMSVKPPLGTGRVRLLKIGDIDLQPCGGTHVANTSEIGRLVVAKIENKGKQNRRVHLNWATD